MRDSGELLKFIHQSMINAGTDVDEIYQRLGHQVRNRLLAKFRTRHALQPYFWRVVEDVTDDEDIGLSLCTSMPMYRGHIIEYLFLSSATFGDGLRALEPYQRLVSDLLSINVVQDDQGTRITVQGTSNNAPELRHPEICFTYAIIRIMDMVTENKTWPYTVHLACERRSAQKDYEAVFGCPVKFGASVNEIWINPEALTLPSRHSDPYMLQLHKRHADSLIADLARQDLMDDVHSHLMGSFDDGEFADGATACSADVAAALGLSPRKLRRQLAEAETSFRELFKQCRHAYAGKMLRSTAKPVETIAARVGFSEASAFYRAFKEWAGVTPSQYRQRYRNCAKSMRASGKVVTANFGKRRVYPGQAGPGVGTQSS